MITLNAYSTLLSSRGRNLGDIRKNQSDMLMNATFTGDVGYKRVYILTKNDGWHYTDAKYSKHATPSILRDAVDRYLQFRPKEHYPIGTYVFIPDDTDPDIGFSEEFPKNPLKDPNFNIHKLWMIVGRNDATQFVRYQIIQCNWNFKWLDSKDGIRRIFSCYGAVRAQSSYTSGVWRDEYSVQLDQITGAWLPNTYLLYGDKLQDFDIDDSRYLMHEQRMMITVDQLDPKCYMVTKITDMNPQGIFKVILKQDDFNEKRDNPDLLICDYYNDSGDALIDNPIADPQDEEKVSKINWMKENENGELVVQDDDYTEILSLGKTVYFKAQFSNVTAVPEWNVELLDDASDSEKARLEKMMVIKKFDSYVISLRPSKANSLIGKHFRVSVSDNNGFYYSYVDVEVGDGS